MASETVYRFAVAESKRVLRPGGYLEASVLDIDMLNMGNRGRRATRALKERLHAADRELSLKPLSDSMQRLLGRRGFQGISRCFVGVPAAGCIPRSRPASGTGTPATESSFQASAAGARCQGYACEHRQRGGLRRRRAGAVVRRPGHGRRRRSGAHRPGAEPGGGQLAGRGGA